MQGADAKNTCIAAKVVLNLQREPPTMHPNKEPRPVHQATL